MKDTILILDELHKEYKDKFSQYEEIYLLARKLDNEKIQDLAIKELAGLKQLIDYLPTFKQKIT